MPPFAKYVRSVEGFAVARFGSGSRGVANELIGAVRIAADRIEWDTAKVTPLPQEYCDKYLRELRGCFKRGELVEVSEDDYLATLPTEPQEPVKAVKKSKQEPSK